MLIDKTYAPVLLVRAHVESDTPLEEQFQQLLGENQPFVLVTDHSEDDHRNETKEDRKKRVEFFKQIKQQMRQLCRGMIVLENDKPIPAAARAAALTASKAFGYPILFAASEEDAIKQGQQLMAKDQG
ncbi:hypothetical protein BTJ39_15230 [Izhakiella australiensis]|uniref:Uncharacterized protein n=1 Tax=Izhakiella australiensis TaxID=1926881 RepID=A0A1S8YIU6_9GAMM|nr:hypothetical protein [Izhakiella australiensis]OON38999.1 hypothetical protein BTJ39_15230 [Izhakiella australiensis]